MSEQKVESALSFSELEILIRRTVGEELARLLQQPHLLDDWSHAGPADPAGDAKLLSDVLAQIDLEQTTPTIRLSWEQAQAELQRAEAAGELPHRIAPDKNTAETGLDNKVGQDTALGWQSTRASQYQTDLGRKLAALRTKIIESGEPLLSREEIEQEVAQRRGERCLPYATNVC